MGGEILTPRAEQRIDERVAAPQERSAKPRLSTGQFGVWKNPRNGKLYLATAWKDGKVYGVELAEVTG